MNTFGLNRPVYSFGLGVPGAFLIETIPIEIFDTGGGATPYSSDISIFEREDMVMIAIIKEFMNRIY